MMEKSHRAYSLDSFNKLAKARAAMTTRIVVLILVILAVNLMLMTVFMELGAQPISEGSPISIAMAFSIFVVIFGAMVCGFYVWWANSKLDSEVEKVRKELLDKSGEERSNQEESSNE